ncbi:MAG: hypothetical protein BGO76_05815 [Caedibacter sp. 38-128]|nr:hypothetical protein [Holosporales bacterium]OJX03562.1 MAG: hypothetical protein BGO76_05815 [Caedibacter sp. 38-128]
MSLLIPFFIYFHIFLISPPTSSHSHISRDLLAPRGIVTLPAILGTRPRMTTIGFKQCHSWACPENLKLHKDLAYYLSMSSSVPREKLQNRASNILLSLLWSVPLTHGTLFSPLFLAFSPGKERAFTQNEC